MSFKAKRTDIFCKAGYQQSFLAEEGMGDPLFLLGVLFNRIQYVSLARPQAKGRGNAGQSVVYYTAGRP